MTEEANPYRFMAESCSLALDRIRRAQSRARALNGSSQIEDTVLQLLGRTQFLFRDMSGYLIGNVEPGPLYPFELVDTQSSAVLSDAFRSAIDEHDPSSVLTLLTKAATGVVLSLADSEDDRLKANTFIAEEVEGLERSLVHAHTVTAEIRTREAEDAEERATSRAVTALDEHYAAHRKAQSIFGGLWTAATIGLLVATITIAIAYAGTGNEVDLAAIVRKLAVGIPLLALAGYCGRQATIHREEARHAQHVVLQLRTIRAFLAELDRDDKRRVMTAFGLAIFRGGPIAPGGEHGTGGLPMDDVSQLLTLINEGRKAPGQ